MVRGNNGKSEDTLYPKMEEKTAIAKNHENESISIEIDDEGLIDTGVKDNNKNYYFSTKDILTIAVLGVMGGIISGLIPFSLLVKTWYPLMGGSQLTSGHHYIWLVLAYGITKNKLSPIITGSIKGFVMFMVGANWGILEIAFSAYEGALVSIFFWLVEKLGEGDTMLGWCVASGLANVGEVPLFWIISGKIKIYHPSLFILAMMFAFISGVFIAGMLSKLIVKKLKDTGVV